MSGTTNVPSVCVLVYEGSKALFVLRSNTGYKDNQYAVPCGHVEDGESFREAAARELKEEADLNAEIDDLEYKLTVHRKEPGDIRIDVWFVAKKTSGQANNAEPNKHSKIEWLDLDNLPENVIDYIAFGVEKIKSSERYGEFGFQVN